MRVELFGPPKDENGRRIWACVGRMPVGGHRQFQLGEFFSASLPFFIALCLAIAAAVWAIIRMRSRYRENEDPAVADHQLLSQIGDLRRQGTLSDEEFRSIKGRLEPEGFRRRQREQPNKTGLGGMTFRQSDAHVARKCRGPFLIAAVDMTPFVRGGREADRECRGHDCPA